MERMNFGGALEALKAGRKVARKGWNGKGIYLGLQKPDANSKMTQPYLYIVTNGLITDNPDAPKGIVPWLASQTDMLAEDWYCVDYLENIPTCELLAELSKRTGVSAQRVDPYRREMITVEGPAVVLTVFD